MHPTEVEALVNIDLQQPLLMEGHHMVDMEPPARGSRMCKGHLAPVRRTQEGMPPVGHTEATEHSHREEPTDTRVPQATSHLG